MRSLGAFLLAFAPAAALLACSSGESNLSSGHVTSSGAAPAGAGGGAPGCIECINDQGCPAGARCAQFAGDAYCAPECAGGAACASGRACTALNSAENKPVQVCIPVTNICGGGAGAGGAPSTTSASSGATSSASSASSASASSSSGGPMGTVGPGGGTLDKLLFAIVGDTRPATIDDTAAYPKAVIQKIWQDVEAAAPRPAFAITTGDYMFAKPSGAQAGPQLDIYLAARAAFSNTVFPVMGNHECTGATASNCGQGNADGVTSNYTAFLQKMLAPLGQANPYYTILVNGSGGAWTAKFVFIAGNAWSAAQAAWFDGELAKPTSYTFVVRHEGSSATTAPGVTPSAQIMAKHPYTILIAGHTHTYAHYASSHEVIIGNGGAPLSGGVQYGYVIAAQRADGAITFTDYDYDTNAVYDTFAVKADGSAAP